MLNVLKKPNPIERSYQLLALLSVCELAARNLPGEAGNLANVIELAGEIAGEVHDVLETLVPEVFSPGGSDQD